MNAIGLVAFASVGTTKAMRERFDLFGVTVVGLVTAFAGGAPRDVLVNRVPFYAGCAVLGGGTYWTLVTIGNARTAAAVWVVVTVGTRLTAVNYDWNLPTAQLFKTTHERTSTNNE